jgi:ornithine carrier protein
VGKIIEHPFDTVKTRLQVQPLTEAPAFSGTLDCIKQGLQAEGLKSFYKGLTAPLVGSMFENSVLFVSYSRIQNLIRNLSGQSQDAPLSQKQLCTAGFLSGGCVSFVLTPVELIKTRLQVQTPGAALKGPLSVVYHTVRQNGISGLYRGHISTFMREAVGGAAWFGTYEYVKNAFVKHSAVTSKDELSTWQLMVSGALSGIAYNASLFPVDTIKSRAQAFESNDSFKKIATDIFRADGIRGFYRGFGITLARSAPSSAIIFATYEWLKRNVKIEY